MCHWAPLLGTVDPPPAHAGKASGEASTGHCPEPCPGLDGETQRFSVPPTTQRADSIGEGEITLKQRGDAETPPAPGTPTLAAQSLLREVPRGHKLATRPAAHSHELFMPAFLSFEVSPLNLMAESPRGQRPRERQSALSPKDTGQAMAVQNLDPESRCRPGCPGDIPSPHVCSRVPELHSSVKTLLRTLPYTSRLSGCCRLVSESLHQFSLKHPLWATHLWNLSLGADELSSPTTKHVARDSVAWVSRGTQVAVWTLRPTADPRHQNRPR